MLDTSVRGTQTQYIGIKVAMLWIVACYHITMLQALLALAVLAGPVQHACAARWSNML